MYNRVTNISRSFRVTRKLSAEDICHLPDFLLNSSIHFFCDLTTLEIKKKKDVLLKFADRVTKLEIGSSNIDDDNFIVREVLPKLKRITSISIFGGGMIGFIMKQIIVCKFLPDAPPLLSCPLTHVTLNKIDGDISPLILHCHKSLKFLELHFFKVDTADMTFVKHMEKLPKLDTLSLVGDHEGSLEKMFEVLKNLAVL